MKYQIKGEKSGFKPTTETIDLPLGKNNETYTMEKQLLLNK